MGKRIHTHLTIYPPLIMEDQLKVIIRCLVYNHEPYLRDCLEGFVIQQTNFPFKAVVHDDASTDNSAAIIREYAEKYPHIIEPIYETENQYSKHDGSLGRIMNAATLGRSPYIAYCEGDDYWIDPLKLQKQVDYMDAHPDYSMCFSACKIKKEQGCTIWGWFKGENIESRDYSATEMLQTWCVPTASICIRAEVAKDKRICQYDKRKTCGDIFIVLTAAHHGKVRGMQDKMTVYRINPGSVMQSRSTPKEALRFQPRLYKHYVYIKENYPLIDKLVMKELLRSPLMHIYHSPLATWKERIFAFIKALFISPKKTAKDIIRGTASKKSRERWRG